MINRLFQLACVLLLAILILRILGKSEKPAVNWAGQRIQQSVAKTSGKPAQQPQSSPADDSVTQSTPAAQRAECPNGTQRTDSIYLGEALALQFRKQSSTFRTIAQIENQLGQPNCKGTGKAVWLTNDGKALEAVQEGNKVKVNFSGF